MRTLRYLGIIFALFLSGCISDAPRINPLDPVHQLPQGVLLSGSVERLFSSTAIPEAMLTLKPDYLIVRADMNGNFQFDLKEPSGQYTLVCEATGFLSDSVQFELPGDTTITFKLDALPTFTEISVTTLREASFIPPDDFFMDIAVSADDIDAPGDIDLVWYELPAIGFVDTLQQLNQQGQYFKRLEPHNFGVSALEELFGKAFQFYVRDVQGGVSQSTAQFITRIIEEAPVTVAPIDTATTIPFQFRWQSFLKPYPFTYDIEIYLNVAIALPPEDAVRGIPSDQTSVIYNNPALEPGNYFWVLYVVDEFGNRSRSIQTGVEILGN